MRRFVVGCKRRAALVLLALLASLPVQAGWVTLAWDPVEYADGYRVYWGTQSRVYSQSNDVGTATQTTITGLVNTVTYYFAVTAYDFAGESDYSEEVSATIPPLPTPEYLQVVGGSLCWSIPEQPDTLRGFYVYRKEAGIKAVKSWCVNDPNLRSLAMPDLLPGSTYQFWVAGFTVFGTKAEHNRRVIRSEASEKLEYQEPLVIYTGQFLLLPPFPRDAGGVKIVFFDSVGDRRQVWGSFDLRAWAWLGEATEVFQGQYQYLDLLDAEARFYRVEK